MQFATRKTTEPTNIMFDQGTEVSRNNTRHYVDLLSEDLQNVLSNQCSVEKSGISHVTNCSSKATLKPNNSY